MKPLGRQQAVEFYGCDSGILNDREAIERIMLAAAKAAGATVVAQCFHTFNPIGVSGVVIIAESHLAIHAWPELGYAAVDLFTCGDSIDNAACFERIKTGLAAASYDILEISRGGNIPT